METSTVKMMNEIFVLLMMATVVQFAAEVFKPAIAWAAEGVGTTESAEKIYQVILLSIRLIAGVAISFAIGADIFYSLGASPDATAVGIAITGIVAAGGSGAVHDLLRSLQGMRANVEG